MITLRLSVAALVILVFGAPFAQGMDSATARGEPAATAIAAIDDYWTVQYSAGQHPYTSPEVTIGEEPADNDCLASATVVYCATDGVIYVGDAAAFALTDDPADVRTLTALAYAWGESLAATWSVETANGDAEAGETFAGCAAGVYIGHLWFGFATGEGDVMAAVDTIGSLSNTSRAQTDERVLAFMTGFVVGFSGCLDLP